MSLDPRVGTRIGEYEIQQLIGRGGMSVVYLAEHIRLHRKVALKLLSPELAEDDTFRRRFTSEWERLAQLDHPNIIPIFEAGEAGGLLFIAMRYVQTTDLKGLIGHEGRLETERAVSIIAQIASALDAAHQQDLVHRDVKPHNILVATGYGAEGEDHVYLSDFGLTKHTQSRSGLTQTGHFMGTIDYVAPEQIAGKTVDGRTDEYALGCVLYECLTGRPPFQREEDTAILFAHLQEPPPLVSELRPDLPPSLDEVIATAMAKDPDQRYPTCLDFARAVKRVVRLGSTPAGGLSRPSDGAGVGIAGSEGVLAGSLAVTEPTPAMDPRLGSTIGRYHLKEVLGRGAMGVVYLGEHTVTGKQVALKLMSPHLFADPQAMQRFLQEARAADVLEHPNIVPIFDADQVDGVPYIAMKRVQGESLADTIEREGALDPPRGLGLLGQVATALDFAHERGIVHRDVKPHNILIASEEDPAGADQAYLCDFGIIKDTAVSRGLTSPAQTVGTRDYMAPEQFRGDPVDGRTDVYALGCVLFETLTGSPPFASDGADALMYAHLEKAPPSAHERRPDLPSDIDGVLFKALAKRQEDRFDKPTDLLMAAWRSIAGQPAEVPQGVVMMAEDVVGVSASAAMPPMPTVIAAAPGAPADVGSTAPWQADPGVVAPSGLPVDPTVAAASFSPPIPVQERTGSDGAMPDLAPPPPAPPGAPAPSGAKPGRGRLVVVAVIVGVLALVGGVAIALSGGDDDPARAGGPTGPAVSGPAETGPTGGSGVVEPTVKAVNPPRNVDVATRAPGLIRIEWKAAAAGGEVAHFLVIRDGEEVDQVRQEFYRDTDVSPGETHEYLIVAVGEDGSEAPAERPVKATVPAPAPPPSTGGDTGGGDTGGGGTGGGGDTCTAEEFFNGECTP